MRARRNSGYSANLAKEYIPTEAIIYSLSTGLSQQVKWVEGKPTDEVTGFQAWFITEGSEPFKVKFTNKIDLPKYLTKISFEDLQACEVGSNIYFKANNIKEIK